MTVIDDIAGAAMESEANEVQEVKLNESARQRDLEPGRGTEPWLWQLQQQLA